MSRFFLFVSFIAQPVSGWYNYYAFYYLVIKNEFENYMNKKALYISIFVVILLIVSGTLYVKQTQAAKSFSYQGVNYNCEETQAVADDSPTVIKLVQQADGTIMISNDGKEYKCTVKADASKPADVVLDNSGKEVKVLLSDTQGKAVEVKDAQTKLNADGNLVIFDAKGMSIKMQDGGLVEVNDDGSMNIDTPNGSVQSGTLNESTGARNSKIQTKEGSVQTKEDGSMNIQTSQGGVQMNGTGGINVQTSQGSVQTQGWGAQSQGSDAADVAF